MFKRNSLTQNRALSNKLDGNVARNLHVFEKTFSKRNVYNNFNAVNNRTREKEYAVAVSPDYVTVEYSCMIWTHFLEQMDKLVESLNFASRSYWGDPNKFQFYSSIESFQDNLTIEIGEDRLVRNNFTLTLNGYLIPDVMNKSLASANRVFGISNVVFGLETATSTEQFIANQNKPVERRLANVIASDSQNIINQITFNNTGSFVTTSSFNAWTGSSTSQFAGTASYALSAENATSASYALSASYADSALSASYALNGGSGSGSIDPATLTYLNTNVNLTGIFVDNVTITFASSWLAAPSGLPTTSVDNFMFFCNGQFIEKTAIVSFVDNLHNTSTLTINPLLLQYNFEVSDEVVAIGKFA
jgi:hypothetical protein